MPVTARLSKLFYETLGEQVANEIVEWFNQVDATYRSDLKELNELNFARFEAKLEQRLGEMKIEITTLRSELNAKLAESQAVMERRLGDQTRWMFLCWATLLASNIALWMR